MIKYLLLFCLISISFAYDVHHASVYYNSDTLEWIIIKGDDFISGAYAWSIYKESVNVTGWDVIDIVTNSSNPDLDQAYAAGYLEVLI